MFRTWLPGLAGAMLLCSACHPPRTPEVRRPLEIEGKVKEPPIKAPANEIVRVGLRVEETEVSVGCLGAIEAVDLVSRNKETWPPGRYVFTAKKGTLYLDGSAKGTKWRLNSDDREKFLHSGNNEYRGELVVRVAGENKVTVVNELSIDDYLKGVLPREVVVTWPDEALKVQAVASRTYLASHLGSHAAQGFDLCSDVHCQVYGGRGKEHPSSNAAVEGTSDEVIVYEGKPIGAYFHSNCGGTTEKIGPVWGQTDKPYLPRKKCSFGTADPRYHWNITFANADMLQILKAKTKVTGSKLKSVRIAQKSPSGRAQTMAVVTDKGTFHLSGNEFRIALNPEKIRSTLFTKIQAHSAATTFAGMGWGHGVGMCQWGAKGQAEQGKDYRDILAFYYPHTEIKKWSR